MEIKIITTGKVKKATNQLKLPKGHKKLTKLTMDKKG
jgi:hypothetical protein